MSREALSQDEIDALLKSLADEPHVTSVLSEQDKNALAEFGNIFLAGSATALTTLLGAQTMVTVAKVAATTKRTLSDEVPGRCLVAELHVTSSFSGVAYLVVDEGAAATAAGLMTGTGGTSELSEAHLPMVRELLEQLVANGAKALSDLIDSRTTIQFGEVALKDLGTDDLSPQLLPDDMLIKLIYRWQVGDAIDSELLLIMPQAMGDNIVAALTGSAAGPVPAAPVVGAGVSTVGVTPPAPAALAGQPGAAATTRRAQAAPPNGGAPARAHTVPAGQVTVQPAEFGELPRYQAPEASSNIDLLLDVPLNLTVELGRTKKTIREILSLGPGSVVELEKLAGETVDILVGGKLMAKGEVVVIDENFAVRITDIVSPVDRLNNLR